MDYLWRLIWSILVLQVTLRHSDVILQLLPGQGCRRYYVTASGVLCNWWALCLAGCQQEVLLKRTVCVEVNYFLKAGIVSLANQSQVDHSKAPSGALVGLTGMEVQLDCSSLLFNRSRSHSCRQWSQDHWKSRKIKRTYQSMTYEGVGVTESNYSKYWGQQQAELNVPPFVHPNSNKFKIRSPVSRLSGIPHMILLLRIIPKSETMTTCSQ